MNNLLRSVAATLGLAAEKAELRKAAHPVEIVRVDGLDFEVEGTGTSEAWWGGRRRATFGRFLSLARAHQVVEEFGGSRDLW